MAAAKRDFTARSSGPDPTIRFLSQKTRELGIREVMIRTQFPASTLRHWMRGQSVPPADRMRKWANAVGYDIGLRRL